MFWYKAESWGKEITQRVSGLSLAIDKLGYLLKRVKNTAHVWAQEGATLTRTTQD